MSEDQYALTELQVAILRILWNREEATTQEIHQALESERALALTTIATILSRLEKRGVVRHRKVGRQYAYRARVTESEVRRSKLHDLTENLFHGDPAALVSHLLRSDQVADGDLARIKSLIAEAEREAGD